MHSLCTHIPIIHTNSECLCSKYDNVTCTALFVRTEIVNISRILSQPIVMPVEDCFVVEWGSCRRYKRIEIFKLPSKSTDQNHQSKLISDIWKSAWLNEISKHRVVDKTFREQIEKGNVYTCKKHFNPF